MELILASRNQKKLREMEALLAVHFSDIRLLSLDDVGLEGDIEEDGSTYEENALIKARAAMEASGRTLVAMADDSGLSVDALNGAPGVYSARYAGEHGDDAANNALLLKNLAEVPLQERTARFVCCVALVYPDGRELTVRGETEGLILPVAKGEGGFGYDPYFYYPPLQKTFSELTSAEKNAVSHRGKAMAKLAALLRETLGEA